MLLPSGVSIRTDAKAASRPISAAGAFLDGQELRGMSVAERDRAGLIEQYHIDIAGQFDRLAALGENIGLQCPIHSCDPDRGE